MLALREAADNGLNGTFQGGFGESVAIATFSGRQLVRILPGMLLRRITGAACSVLAVVALVATIRG